MNIVSSLLNQSEDVVHLELQKIAADNGMRVFAKTKLSDVIVKGRTSLTQREFDFYTRGHFDFVIADDNARPLMVVEYDGPLHRTSEKQQERDEIKNELCRRAELGILRINDNHVTKLYRGMTLLRWIIEVRELESAFYEAQTSGQIPWDEPFDPTFLGPAGSAKHFPYWLSAAATQSFHDFFGTIDRSTPKGWTSILGSDGKGNGFRLSCLYFGGQILWAQTGVRRQDRDFPHYDLLDQIDTCELGVRLRKFRKGEIASATRAEFKAIFETFCARYSASPSHSMGSFPFETSWDGNEWHTRK